MLDLSTDQPLFRKLWRKKAYMEVAEQIRDKIFSDKLKLFQRLPSERDLAEQFGVSRVVVREAIRTLESSGLVTVKKGPKGGIFVAQDYERPIVDSITNLLAGGEVNLDNLFEVRLLIEPYAAARVAELGTEADFDALEAKLAEAEREHGADESVRHRYIDFHRQILRLSRNPLLSIVGETVLLVLYDRVKQVVSADTSRGRPRHAPAPASRRCASVSPPRRAGSWREDIEMLSRRFAEFSAVRAAKHAPRRRRAAERERSDARDLITVNPISQRKRPWSNTSIRAAPNATALPRPSRGPALRRCQAAVPLLPATSSSSTSATPWSSTTAPSRIRNARRKLRMLRHRNRVCRIVPATRNQARSARVGGRNDPEDLRHPEYRSNFKVNELQVNPDPRQPASRASCAISSP